VQILDALPLGVEVQFHPDVFKFSLNVFWKKILANYFNKNKKLFFLLKEI